MRYVYIFLLLGIASICDAQLVPQPEGLEPGDQYRLIFTTSQKRDATSANIEDYNNFVQSVADSSPEVASWGIDWKAIVSTPSVDAVANTLTDWRTADGLPIYRIDGELVAENNEDLWNAEAGDRIWTVLLDLDEGGRLIPGDADFPAILSVFTGTNSAGMASPIGAPPEDRGLGAVIAAVGNAYGRGPQDRYNLTTTRLDNVHHFYALSDVITAVPEPQTGVAMSLGVITVAACLRKRRALETM